MVAKTTARKAAAKTIKALVAATKKKKQKNAVWLGGPEQEQAYDTLKAALVNAPILTHPDFTKPFIVDSDACQYALGAVISQVGDDGLERPIAYASRTMSKSERNYPTNKREALGGYWAVCKAFRAYTYGAPFLLRTDHSCLTRILSTGEAPESVIAGWQMALSV